MSWDEALFGFGHRLWQRLIRKPDHESLGQAALLGTERNRLSVMCRALTGAPIDIKEAEGVGGVIDQTVLLPRIMDVFVDPLHNQKAYLLRALYSSQVFQLGLCLPASCSIGSEEQVTLSLLVAPVVLAAMERELPGLRSLFAPLFDTPELSTPDQVLKVIGLLLPAERSRPRSQGRRSVAPAESLPSGTELQGQVRQKVRKLKVEEDSLAENPLTHAFEKVKTADDYRGGQKPLDGEDELADHAAALSELDLRTVVRSHKRTQSVYRADVLLDVDSEDLEEAQQDETTAFRYDEWDEAHRRYKAGFCQVFASRAQKSLPNEVVARYLGSVRQKHRRQIAELRRRLSVLRNERKWQNRQYDGPEIDLQAIVDRHASLASLHTPPDRLYLAQRPMQRDLATLILIDSSLSTDSWVENHRVLDLAREAIIVLGDVLQGFEDQVALAGFYSNTREDCRYITYKDFAQSWTGSYARLLSQQPTGYTRIGPALRHATRELGKIMARKKLLLLISDGKPTDYDRYEGRYGIADCRQAIHEARGQGMFVRMLAIDARAKAHLAEMFGAGHYQVLPHAHKLVGSLGSLYAQLAG